ncbi:hypothetical protein E3N88_27585 [Mikania micrantha]|uniref:Uncharacterized protein n=1 Tax=Mikania micrantha TaxID=192012 RepID=A0A5N6MYL4_9ASTR|nr:hypothetical protein E3N88_27585 [Mikania micrantha]
MNLQFPNGQLIYVASEGLSTSAFLPVFGGLLQAQGQYPGQMRFSFSSKLGRSKWNENIGKSEMVLKVETPLGNVGQPSFSVQLNSGIEF